jgi:hypothetical protein
MTWLETKDDKEISYKGLEKGKRKERVRVKGSLRRGIPDHSVPFFATLVKVLVTSELDIGFRIPQLSLSL